MIEANVTEMKDKVRRIATAYALRPDLAQAIEKKETTYLQNLGKR